jgi:hypothetical protein
LNGIDSSINRQNLTFSFFVVFKWIATAIRCQVIISLFLRLILELWSLALALGNRIVIVFDGLSQSIFALLWFLLGGIVLERWLWGLRSRRFWESWIRMRECWVGNS